MEIGIGSRCIYHFGCSRLQSLLANISTKDLLKLFA